MFYKVFSTQKTNLKLPLKTSKHLTLEEADSFCFFQKNNFTIIVGKQVKKHFF